MKLIVGIGNPGNKYDETPHNVGFSLLDYLGQPNEWKKSNQTLIQKISLDGQPLLLVKPVSYVNLSGQALKPIAQFYKITAKDIIVLVDDVNIPFGALRIRSQGSHGGHNGLKNLIQYFGDQFVRIRIGVGICPPHWDLSHWVLKKMKPDEKESIETTKDKIEAIILCGINEGWDIASTRYNRKI